MNSTQLLLLGRMPWPTTLTRYKRKSPFSRPFVICCPSTPTSPPTKTIFEVRSKATIISKRMTPSCDVERCTILVQFLTKVNDNLFTRRRGRCGQGLSPPGSGGHQSGSPGLHRLFPLPGSVTETGHAAFHVWQQWDLPVSADDLCWCQNRNFHGSIRMIICLFRRRQLSPDMFKCLPKAAGSPCTLDRLKSLNLFARNFYLCSEAPDDSTVWIGICTHEHGTNPAWKQKTKRKTRLGKKFSIIILLSSSIVAGHSFLDVISGHHKILRYLHNNSGAWLLVATFRRINPQMKHHTVSIWWIKSTMPNFLLPLHYILLSTQSIVP